MWQSVPELLVIDNGLIFATLIEAVMEDHGVNWQGLRKLWVYD